MYGFVEDRERILKDRIISIKGSQNRIKREDGKYVIINPEERSISKVYKEIGEFVNGLAVALIPNNRRIVIDSDGNEVTSKSYEKVFIDDEVIHVSNKGLWGFVSFKGKQVLPPTYEFIEKFNNNMARVKVDNLHWGIIGVNGKMLFEPKYSYIGEPGERIILCKCGRYGVCDKKSNVVIPFVYRNLYEVTQALNRTI